MNHSKSFDGKGVYKFEIDMMIDFIKIPSLDKNLITTNVKLRIITNINRYISILADIHPISYIIRLKTLSISA